MKINFRKLRKIRCFVILYVLFCLMFPYSLFSAETNYKVPKNSISYFSNNPTQKEVSVVAPPVPVKNQEALPPAPSEAVANLTEADNEEALTQPYENENKIVEDNAKEHFDLSWQNEEPVKKEIKSAKTVKTSIANKPKSMQPVPEVTAIAATSTGMKQVTPVAQASRKMLSSNNDSPVFSEVLARMQKRSAERKAEAEKLGIILPSQGGDMSAVSPSLSKIKDTINNIVDRHHCPAQGTCNFCK
jgi:hypothetical protein